MTLALAACGSSSSSSKSSSAPTPTPTATAAAASSGGGAAQTINISADPSALKFDKKALSAKAGKVTIVMANPSQIPHAIEIEGNGVEGKGQVVTKGGTSKTTVDLKPGTYDFYCPVDGHRGSGMEGKLTVK